jgi:hypothetical protein
MLQAGVRAHPAAYPGSVHLRHVDVEQDQARPHAMQQRQTILAARYAKKHVAGVGNDARLKREIVSVIVDADDDLAFLGCFVSSLASTELDRIAGHALASDRCCCTAS